MCEVARGGPRRLSRPHVGRQKATVTCLGVGDCFVGRSGACARSRLLNNLAVHEKGLGDGARSAKSKSGASSLTKAHRRSSAEFRGVPRSWASLGAGERVAPTILRRFNNGLRRRSPDRVGETCAAHRTVMWASNRLRRDRLLRNGGIHLLAAAAPTVKGRRSGCTHRPDPFATDEHSQNEGGDRVRPP